MSTSWFTVESPGTNPDCRVVSMLLSRMKLNKCLCTIFPKTLPTALSRDIGQRFFYNLNKNEKYHLTTLKLEMNSSN